jgi:hypothetical protein
MWGWVAHSTVAPRSEQMTCFSGTMCELRRRRAPESRAFPKGRGRPERTQNRKREKAASSDVAGGGSEGGPFETG